MHRVHATTFAQLIALLSLLVTGAQTAAETPADDEDVGDSPAQPDMSAAQAEDFTSQADAPDSAGGSSVMEPVDDTSTHPSEAARLCLSRCRCAGVQRPSLRRERGCLPSRSADASCLGRRAQHTAGRTGSGHAPDHRTRIGPRCSRAAKPVYAARGTADRDRCADARWVFGARGGASLAALA